MDGNGALVRNGDLELDMTYPTEPVTDVFIMSYVRQIKTTLFPFYRAMLCIRGTRHGPVSVCPSVCPSVSHKSVFY